MPKIYTANRSNVLVDGEAVDGVQTLHYRVVVERHDIRALGSDERVDVAFGLRTVEGELVVRSSADKLDTHLAASTKIQLVANSGRDDTIDTTLKSTYSYKI